MKNILATLVLVVAAAPLALALGPVPKCPKCHMALAVKKDKAHTEAVKIKGKTYYCCAACGAHTKKKH